ncbi:MAG: FAD-dependent oxidoreductase [Clostridium sp.]|nr:FAD-dependent oxidoreductase [Clostridium sp.]
MIRINQIKCEPKQVTKPDGGMDEALLKKKAASVLKVSPKAIRGLWIRRRSIDARKKPQIFYIFSVDVVLTGMSEEQALVKAHSADCQISPWTAYVFPEEGKEEMQERPVIVGMGPAGLFCAYELALHGYRPILLERGKCVEARAEDVARFWQEGVLSPESNVQFGEGGAGAFSDGKLNTLVKDKDGRCAEVLRILCAHGAKEEICYDHKPHIGTDALCVVVRSMREAVIAHGGEIHFETKMTGLHVENGKVTGVTAVCGGQEQDGLCGGRTEGIPCGGQEQRFPCGAVVLAIGHSARDTVQTLYESGMEMEAKPFAVGLRVEHPQTLINRSQYGTEDAGILGAAAYKLTAQTKSGRGVYTFCMCPGGYVVNASSEPGMLAVNGMSYSGRDGGNANSAVIVTVTPEDYGDTHPLSGIAFQRELERRAYAIGGGKVPVERYGDFRAEVFGNAAGSLLTGKAESGLSASARADEELDGRADGSTLTNEKNRAEVMCDGAASSGACADGRTAGTAAAHTRWEPCIKGAYTYAKVAEILPRELAEAFAEGMEAFGRKIPHYNDPDTLLEGVESRTSSPVRMLRNEELVCRMADNLYPCGEGAGYAGGIVSAAMDGVRVAEAIARKYRRIRD